MRAYNISSPPSPAPGRSSPTAHTYCIRRTTLHGARCTVRTVQRPRTPWTSKVTRKLRKTKTFVSEFDFSSNFITRRHQSRVTYSSTLRTTHYGFIHRRLRRERRQGACEWGLRASRAHPSLASREGSLEVLIVDGAIEVALVYQRVDDAPDLRVGHAVRRHRVGASGATQ